MGNLFKWACVASLGLMVCLAGASHIENPDNNVFSGMLVLYSGIFIFIVGTLQMARGRTRDAQDRQP
jgi:hypothetical protein